MKTAMQELKKDLQESIDGLPETLRNINDPFVRKTVTDAVLIAYKCVLKRIDDDLLEKEKQQFIEAYRKGYVDAYLESVQSNEPEKYYNETFS